MQVGNLPIATRRQYGIADSDVPAGAVVGFAQSSAPEGWLKCNGAALNRFSYSELFAAIGITFGAGDGATTFNIPDLRGEFIRGWDDGRGVDSGRVFGSFQASQMQSHTHSIPVGTTAGGAIPQQFSTTQDTTVSSGATGGTSNGSENRPRSVALLYCIKF